MWGEALNATCPILNSVFRKHIEKTPYKLLKSKKTILKYFHVWGALQRYLKETWCTNRCIFSCLVVKLLWLLEL